MLVCSRFLIEKNIAETRKKSNFAQNLQNRKEFKFQEYETGHDCYP